MQYRRADVPGTSYFFTLNLTNRKSDLLIKEIEKLKQSISFVKFKHPFDIDAMVIMPDHLHMLMTLPEEDGDYSTRWNLIKGYFSRVIKINEHKSISRINKRERGIWQRRFWEHLIRDDNDYERHVNYIHYNPVKHGYVENPTDWKFSSIHKYIAKGILPNDWARAAQFADEGYGE